MYVDGALRCCPRQTVLATLGLGLWKACRSGCLWTQLPTWGGPANGLGEGVKVRSASSSGRDPRPIGHRTARAHATPPHTPLSLVKPPLVCWKWARCPGAPRTQRSPGTICQEVSLRALLGEWATASSKGGVASGQTSLDKLSQWRRPGPFQLWGSGIGDAMTQQLKVTPGLSDVRFGHLR